TDTHSAWERAKFNNNININNNNNNNNNSNNNNSKYNHDHNKIIIIIVIIIIINEQETYMNLLCLSIQGRGEELNYNSRIAVLLDGPPAGSRSGKGLGAVEWVGIRWSEI
ncbi:unnamed protein product, partial [Closterium sp. NIES-54]